MTRKSIFLGIFSFVMTAMVGKAVYADQMMSWQDCVQKIHTGNADLAASVANVKSLDALYGSSYSNFFPQISAQIGYNASSNGGSAPNPGSLTQTVYTSTQYSDALSLNQSLFNGFTDEGKVEQGRANWKAAVAQLELEKVTLSSTLKTNFAQLLFEQKSVELTDAILKRQMTNLRMIDLRFRGGSENKGSLLFQQATVSQARYQHEHAIRQLRNASKQLAALWGDPDNESVRLTGELTAHAPAKAPNFEDIAAKHPNHANYVEQTFSAVAAIKVADGNWYPNVNLLASVGNVSQNEFFDPAGSRWSAGVVLTYPLFPGNSNIFGSQNARALKMQAQFQQYSTDYKLVAALETAYEALLDAVAQVGVSEEFQNAAQARSKIANGKYNTGLMTFEDWTVIDQDLVNREQNLLQSQLNAMQAEATWENAEGVGDIK